METQFGEQISPFVKMDDEGGGSSLITMATPAIKLPSNSLFSHHDQRPVAVHEETENASARLAIARNYLRIHGKRRGFYDRQKALLGTYKCQEEGPAPMPRHVRRELDPKPRVHGQLEAMLLTPSTYKGEYPDIFYIHGGGYCTPPGMPHWWITSELAELLKTRVHCMRYPLIPDSTAIDTVALVVEAYLAVVEELGEAPIVAGDSSGGGLSLALALTLRDIGAPLPQHMVLIAPWIDLTASTPGFEDCESRDPLLALAGIDLASEIYAGALDRRNPIVSPLFGDPTGLGPTTVILGTSDALYAEGSAWVDKAEQAGVDVGTFIAKGGFHVFPAATWLPESQEAYSYIKQRITR